MSTRMDGINQPSLFSANSLRMDVVVSKDNRYRMLANNLPWLELGAVANEYRGREVNINNGRPLNLRLHLGALIAQSMNRWTDRETEEMVGYHAGVRLLCGLEQSNETIDHTSIETFRNQLTAEGVESLNRLIVECAKRTGFTDGKLCSSDTTVQESPIAYPTEVGHMKRIAEKLLGIGSKIRKGLSGKLGKLGTQAKELFTQIRLFTRGETQKVQDRKKKLGKKLQQTVAKMRRVVQSEVDMLGQSSQAKYRDALELYERMLSQIRYWLRTGFHPGRGKDKILSLWEKDARAIPRGKLGKTVEFGRRWIITKLTNGYMIGAACKRLGADPDTSLMPEILSHFENMLGELPRVVVYDRGGDGRWNHHELAKKKIKRNCIFRKGKESLPGIGRNTRYMAQRERALSEATIATIKNPRYGFNKPRARSSASCILKGQAAIFGANLSHLTRDWTIAASSNA